MFEAEIDFAAGDVLTRGQAATWVNRSQARRHQLMDGDKYPKSFVGSIDMFVGCGRMTSKPSIGISR